MKNWIIGILLVALIALAGYTFFDKSPKSEIANSEQTADTKSVETGAGSAVTGLTEDQIKNATIVHFGREIQLHNGSGSTNPNEKPGSKPDEGADYVNYLNNITHGDINGDGLADSVAIVGISTGSGNGTFPELVVFLNKDGKPAFVGSNSNNKDIPFVLSGISFTDSSNIDSVSIIDGKIVVSGTISFGPSFPNDDKKFTRNFIVKDEKVVELK